MTLRMAALAVLMLVGNAAAQAQSLVNVHVGDTISQIVAALGPASGSEQVGSATTSMWSLPNHNELSVTVRSDGKAAYIECDWGGTGADTATGFPDMTFGETTLSEIRTLYQSNGVTFNRRSPVIPVSDGVALMNSYEANGVIITFVTVVRHSEAPRVSGKELAVEMPKHAKLDAILLTDRDYAKSEWGDAVYSPGYKPIDLSP